MMSSLILGFDAECSYCQEMAKKIEKRFGDRLETRNLSDPEVEEWRKQVLGEDAPWAPTLIEVDGDRVKAWTGFQMGFALTRRLGLIATWRLMQVLGEFRTRLCGQEKGSAVPESEVGLTRGQFLTTATKGAAGAALAVSVLGLSSQPAAAQSNFCYRACQEAFSRCGRSCQACPCVRRRRPAGCNCRCKALFCG
jgi:hypothetical protein